MSNSISTFFDQVRFQHAADPLRPLYSFVDKEGRETSRLNYSEFCTAALRVARFLTQDLGLRPTSREGAGDRVLLVYPPGMDFVVSFVGCIFAGLLPVPLPPPNPFRLRGSLEEFEAVAAGSGSRLVLTNGEYLRARRLAAAKNLLTGRTTAWHKLPWHRTDKLKETEVPFELPDARPEDTAFLQYTSGSTSAPKGVMISHRNILHQLRINGVELEIDAESCAVLWVPHFHDFCLVSGILSALFGNGMVVLLSPLSFLRRPAIWFDVMTRVKATHTAAPDFAYRLAVRKTTEEQRKEWDLRSLRVVMSAAEPIRPSTVDGFLSAFAACGLAPSAFCPAYGLAEHTVGVSVRGQERLRLNRRRLEEEGVAEMVDSDKKSEEDSLTFIGCGPPSEGVTVRIVDPTSGTLLGENRMGEIWVDSPSKAEGYWDLPKLSREVFQAPLGEGQFLRTGDLGFLLKGEVFVTGRLKDLIIVRGRNIYPQDLEECAADASPQIRPGRVVAFAATVHKAEGEQGEWVVVVVEVKSEKMPSSELAEVAKAVRRRLKGEHQVSCDEILIARPGEILKTTSGKLRRRACRLAWEEGGLRRRALLVDQANPGG
jgi:acyl-CoA synthetase (AMP-forming)/AMP-acid ligase II